ncbi:MAG: hypothetical protein ACLTSZ_10895 [Lachnospiraceae bacterium]
MATMYGSLIAGDGDGLFGFSEVEYLAYLLFAWKASPNRMLEMGGNSETE